MCRIAVIIPCYNEEATVGKVIAGFKEFLPQATIYVGDNASTDNTAAIAIETGATVINELRRGKGNMLRTMFRKVDADIYLMVDGDDTYSAADAPQLVAEMNNGGFDMVVGDRLSTTYFTQNDRPFHNSGNKLVRRLINLLFNADLKDILTGYRALSRRLVKSMPIQSQGFEIETELTAFALRNDYSICEIPCKYTNRPKGSESKLNTFSDGLRIITTILALFRDYRPMMFFSWLSLAIAAVSMAFVIPPFMEFFREGYVNRFPSLIFGCFLLTAAMLSFFSGLILQVISNQNRRLSALR